MFRSPSHKCGVIILKTVKAISALDLHTLFINLGQLPRVPFPALCLAVTISTLGATILFSTDLKGD